MAKIYPNSVKRLGKAGAALTLSAALAGCATNGVSPLNPVRGYVGVENGNNVYSCKVIET